MTAHHEAIRHTIAGASVRQFAEKDSPAKKNKAASACVCFSMAVRTAFASTLANSLRHSGGATQSESIA